MILSRRGAFGLAALLGVVTKPAAPVHAGVVGEPVYGELLEMHALRRIRVTYVTADGSVRPGYIGDLAPNGHDVLVEDEAGQVVARMPWIAYAEPHRPPPIGWQPDADSSEGAGPDAQPKDTAP